MYMLVLGEHHLLDADVHRDITDDHIIFGGVLRQRDYYIGVHVREVGLLELLDSENIVLESMNKFR